MRSRADLRVLRLTVPSQIDFALESSTAQVASERLETRVLSRVSYEVAALRECLAAYLTLVWFFTCKRKKETQIRFHFEYAI